MVAEPDWDFLAVTLAIVVGLCTFAFGSGWYLARLLRADTAQRAALMFGLGMNNNGTGLVLASMALANYPRVLLPIIFYNLVQHLVAGAVDMFLLRTASLSAPESVIRVPYAPTISAEARQNAFAQPSCRSKLLDSIPAE
jgi:BASS family bile acid:Na+ symporter